VEANSGNNSRNYRTKYIALPSGWVERMNDSTSNISRHLQQITEKTIQSTHKQDFFLHQNKQTVTTDELLGSTDIAEQIRLNA
jgi:hypothetical protein